MVLSVLLVVRGQRISGCALTHLTLPLAWRRTHALIAAFFTSLAVCLLLYTVFYNVGYSLLKSKTILSLTFIMSDTHICSGCDVTFSLRGYHSHLSQTQDPLCRTVLDKLKKSYEMYQLLEQAANSSDEAVEDLDVNNFDNDMDLDSAIEDRNLEDVSDDEEHDDSELEDIGAELETGWEPLRNGAPQEETGGDPVEVHSDIESLDEKSDSDKSSGQRNFDRYIIGDGYGVKPAVRILYSDKYPSSHAGKALSREESRDCGYSASLGGGDNPWAPFHSKKDWEIAQWAKLRGVGSTAFSELLAIDDVSFSRIAIFFCS
jgi:hypothetical protein